jgi:hypothetical protein
MTVDVGGDGVLARAFFRIFPVTPGLSPGGLACGFYHTE